MGCHRKDFDVTVTQLNELAASAPSIVLKAAGLTATAAPVGNSTSDVNTEALNNTPKPDVTLDSRHEIVFDRLFEFDTTTTESDR